MISYNTTKKLSVSQLCLVQDKVEELKEKLNTNENDISVIINDDSFEIKLNYRY